MKIKIGNYTLLIEKSNFMFLDLSKGRNKEIILEKLEKLEELFDSASFEWFLVGGLASDLQIGRITRPHKDIDIQVSSKDAEKLEHFMKSRGYSMFKKVNDFPFFQKRLIILSKCYQEECLPSQSRTIKFIQNYDNHIKKPIHYIDVFFKTEYEKGVEIGYCGKTVILEFPYNGPLYLTPKGHIIKTRNPIYSYCLKINSTRFIDKFDSKNLEGLINKRDLDKVTSIYSPR